jgi:radical SAM superfamily enzyme YgiQ (UPF0313 family)
MSDVLVVSTFEGGYQPSTAITATTALQRGGIDADLYDIYVEGLDLQRFEDTGIVAVSVPLFDSLNAGVQLAAKIRAVNPRSEIVFYGQYATINATRLAGRHGDFAVVGEWERPLVELSRRLLDGGNTPVDGIVDAAMALRGESVHPVFTRNHFGLPNRSLAPPLSKYPQPQLSKLLGEQHIVGSVEATRGCHHRCSYCSVFAAYDGKVLLVGEDLIVEDVRQLVAGGMTHLTFTDADFFNARHHGLKILRRLHAEFPELTYDATTRVDHIMENLELVKESARLGMRVITSALEFPSDTVLQQLDKEITVEMTEACIEELRNSGIRLNPTFIMFNPWIGLEDLVLFEEFTERAGLAEIIDPVQFETRLHLYKGSPLLKNHSVQQLQLEEREFHYEWKHPDPRVDEVYFSSLTPAEEGVFKRCCLKC